MSQYGAARDLPFLPTSKMHRPRPLAGGSVVGIFLPPLWHQGNKGQRNRTPIVFYTSVNSELPPKQEKGARVTLPCRDRRSRISAIRRCQPCPPLVLCCLGRHGGPLFCFSRLCPARGRWLHNRLRRKFRPNHP